MCALKDESSERADFYQGAHALKTASFRDYLSRNQLNYAQSCWHQVMMVTFCAREKSEKNESPTTDDVYKKKYAY